MNRPVISLDNYFLTHQEISFVAPENQSKEVKSIDSSFDYVVSTHTEDESRYLLEFSVGFKELDEQDQPLGHQINVKISGFFTFPENTEYEMKEKLIRYNGVAILYGVLRGIISTATGAFPAGKFLMPTIMPDVIVDNVEKRRNLIPKVAKAKKKVSAKKKTKKKSLQK
jgi:preprotein translocase subunit SecB